MCIPGYGDNLVPKGTGPLVGYRQWSGGTEDGKLLGTYRKHGPQPPGKAEAHCERAGKAPELDDGSGHGCGWWAQWKFDPHPPFYLGEKPVVGAVKGTGRKVYGLNGWRSEKLEILGVHFAYEYVRRTDQTGQATKYIDDLSAPGIYESGTPEAEARMAEDYERFRQAYPGVPIFETMTELEAAFPPSKRPGED